MGLWDGMTRGYSLAIASLRVVSKEPWMIALPIITGIVLFAILLGFVFLPGATDERFSDPLFYVFIIAYFFGCYFCLYFVQAMILRGASRRPFLRANRWQCRSGRSTSRSIGMICADA